MAVKYLAGNRLWGTDAERLAMTVENNPPATAWKEIGRYEVTGSTTQSFTVRGLDSATSGTMTAKDNLMILGDCTTDQTNSDLAMRFNDDGASTGNYPTYWAYNGSFGDQSNNHTLLNGGVANIPNFFVTTIRNKTDVVNASHLSQGRLCYGDATGNSGTVKTAEWVSKWNDSSQITKVQFDNVQSSGTRQYKIGSEVVVLGCNDDEADSGTNFWQLLTNTATISGDSSDVVTSGTFTPKKWLMYEIRVSTNTSNMGNSGLRVGVNGTLDGGTVYVRNTSVNSGSWTSATSNNYMYTADYSSSIGGDIMYRGFICNTAGQSKQAINTSSQAGGSSDYPRVGQSMGRYTANTSSQINCVGVASPGGTNPKFTSATCRVWGAD